MTQHISETDIKQTDESLQEFFDNLGPNDVYKMVFLEVLFSEIYGRQIDLSDLIETSEKQPSSKDH
jgi:hypothetical protein